MKNALTILLGSALLFACNDSYLLERLDAEKSGVTFENTLTESDDFNIIDYLYFFNGGGVATGDINNDGLVDIFFSGNQVKNKLYLNKGNLQFEDISDKAGLTGASSWNTGSVMADFNGDGLLDIYVCAVVGIKGMNGYNELYINNGDLTFTERAAYYGLDYDSFSSTAALIDYDRDGDLDLYLLNHAVHTQESFGHADLRNRRTYETGDKLLKNEGGKFVDVSEEAGIYGGVNGYGLGIAISDFNQDGYPDIYVGNDFHEDDYLYINNGDGTFSEKVKDAFTQISRFSMGNDVADLNHDGYPDLLSLDMLPSDEVVLKRSDGDERHDILQLRTTRYGYYYQFSRNMLQINNGDGTFSESALMNGIAATDWSWSALFADLDMDGNDDVFVSNGIPRRPNDMDYIKFVSSDQIKNTISETKIVDKEALNMMPSGELPNMAFKGFGDGNFQDMAGSWIGDETSFSTATALADLDNDGDMDLVVNNVNSQATIYINQTNGSANYLKLRLNYSKDNQYGIGSKVYSYQGGKLQYKELYTVRGFQASSEPMVHFGYGLATKVDSIKVVWPDATYQVLYDVPVNQMIEIAPQNAKLIEGNPASAVATAIFEKIDPSSIGLEYQHKEDDYSDFKRLKLLPYQQSDRGPATAIGDINGDGKDDIYFGGSKWMPGQLFLQADNGFEKAQLERLAKDSINEETDAVIADFDNNGLADLLIGTGGADFYNKSEPLLDRVYMASNDALTFDKIVLPDVYENAGIIRPFDFDGDGYLDVFIGNESTSNDFGKTPQSVLLKNHAGIFEAVQPGLFGDLGMITDGVWTDYNGDGFKDLIVVGEWMKPTFIKNDNGTFVEDPLLNESLNGLWQSISPFDMDGDGDQDFVLGNWGLNSKFQASREYPLRMYYGDLDTNGSSETILAFAKEGEYYPIAGLDLLMEQMPSIHKRFTSYKDFAGEPVELVLDQLMLDRSTLLTVSELASGYLKNENGSYSFVPFDEELQLSPILSQLVYDFDGDGTDELLLAGNYFGVQPYHGRFGSFGGALIESDGAVTLGKNLGLHLFNHSIRAMNVVSVGNSNYLLATIHDDSVQVYKLR